jgi:hypothetical protein
VKILLVQRGEHNIEHELTFTNHDGYVFHNSRGFEAGDKKELETVQDFVRRRSREGRLNDRLHAIWFVFVLFGYLPSQIHKGLPFRYCIPMDNNRPSLDLKYYEDICPDKNGML